MEKEEVGLENERKQHLEEHMVGELVQVHRHCLVVSEVESVQERTHVVVVSVVQWGQERMRVEVG